VKVAFALLTFYAVVSAIRIINGPSNKPVTNIPLFRAVGLLLLGLEIYALQAIWRAV
jgi:hypothetical protein